MERKKRRGRPKKRLIEVLESDMIMTGVCKKRWMTEIVGRECEVKDE